jgi:hypothetical protein
VAELNVCAVPLNLKEQVNSVVHLHCVLVKRKSVVYLVKVIWAFANDQIFTSGFKNPIEANQSSLFWEKAFPIPNFKKLTNFFKC